MSESGVYCFVYVECMFAFNGDLVLLIVLV